MNGMLFGNDLKSVLIRVLICLMGIIVCIYILLKQPLWQRMYFDVTHNVRISEGYKDCLPINVGITTGSKSGTYYKVGTDMRNLFYSIGDSKIVMNVYESGGSMENYRNLSNKIIPNIDFGIIQDDVYEFCKKSYYSCDLSADRYTLRKIMPLYQESVHIVTLKNESKGDKKSIRDIVESEKPIYIGDKKSGTWFTADNIFGIILDENEYKKMKSKYKTYVNLTKDHEEAFRDLYLGDIIAIAYVAGRPLERITKKEIEKIKKQIIDKTDSGDDKKIIEEAKITFVEIDEKKLKDYGEYADVTITAADYQWLNMDSSPDSEEGIKIKTVGVQSLLVTREVDDKQEKCVSNKSKNAVLDTLYENTDYILNQPEPARHDKWNFIKQNIHTHYCNKAENTGKKNC